MSQLDYSDSVKESYQRYRQALDLIPGGTQLISRRPQLYALGLTPPYASRGKGCRFWDLDGNEYIDWMMSVGASILGYADDRVDEAVMEQIRRGTVYSVSHELELDLARELVAAIPCAEMVRYCKGGGEADALAVRIARAYTGRDKVLFCGYHGWHDWYLAANLVEEDVLSDHLLPNIEPRGVPAGLTGTALPFRYNDLDSLTQQLERNKGEVACIIMEACRGTSQPEPGYLERVRELATDHDVLLIFDEVVTGFRLGLGGAQEYFGVTPDLATYAKAISNGYSMGAVVGKREVMEIAGDLFISSTYWSDAVGIAAALATIRELTRRNAFEKMVKTGRRFQQTFNGLAEENELPLKAVGFPQQVAIVQDGGPAERKKEIKDYYVQEMTRRGFFTSFGVNICYSHGEKELERTAAAWREVFPMLREAIQQDDWDERLGTGRSVEAFRRLVG